MPAVAALLVFAVFAVGILSVLLGGAGVYERLARRDSRAYESRTAVQYLVTKVRQGEQFPRVEAFGSADALVFSQQIGSREFVTRVYCHDGWLRELFTVAGGQFSPEDGEKILPMQSLSARMEGKLLTVELCDGSGERSRITLASRLGEGARP